MNKQDCMTAHKLAEELLKMPKDTVVCFNNGKGLWESVQTITAPENTDNEQPSSTWAFLNLNK